MIEIIKKTIINIMVTTCAVLMLLPVAWVALTMARGIDKPILAVLMNGDILVRVSASVIYEIFLVNTIIHFGFFLTRKFKSPYIVLEYLLDVSFVVLVLVIFGIVFDWRLSIPIWLLVIMGVLVYAFHVLIGILRLKKDAEDLNVLLRKRKERNTVT